MAEKMLSVRDLHVEYRLGRDLAGRLVRLLPCIVVGSAGPGRVRRLTRREVVENLLARAAAEEKPLWSLVREHTAESLAAWLASTPKELR